MNADDFARRVVIDPDEKESPGNDQWRAFRYVLGEMTSAEAAAYEEVLATDQETRELVARSTGVVTTLLTLDAAACTQNEPCNGLREIGLVELPVVGVATSTVATAWVATAAVATLAVRPAMSADFTRGPSQRFRWAIAGLAAAVCCCVAVGLCLLPLAGRTGPGHIYSGDLTDNGAGQLVAIWSQRLAELAPETATTEPTASERSELPLPEDADDSRLTTATENAPADSAAVADQIAVDDSDIPRWMIAAVELGQVRKPDGSSSEIREN